MGFSEVAVRVTGNKYKRSMKWTNGDVLVDAYLQRDWVSLVI